MLVDVTSFVRFEGVVDIFPFYYNGEERANLRISGFLPRVCVDTLYTYTVFISQIVYL